MESEATIANEYINLMFKWGGWLFVILAVAIIVIGIYLWRKKNGKGKAGTHVDQKAGDEGED